ncbi:mitotic checkpoint serine/threonine-protein kinase BUB1 isoform X2 [Archocentrus centrarchus]|uniref:mitotic checkpoint serine/threonine-protein kinase BUB1 isoform X2 n=1 Tax=Archocentrus centrarchus TaxID=63155 RepID=UPI0011E9B982|nr:mitotic checkpoint serine/threonine-protein kinase BUB1 isoform X2 [Archocentrus centrarchus]
MDVASYLQCFESSLTSYTGDDPLDHWVKFVENLEQRLPAGGGSGMLLVFDRLVQRFLNVEQYTNDLRYVNYCIKCASYYSDPVALYSCFFSKGIGTRTAALYVAWAQQFEQKGMNEQADAVYQKALENQAHPASVVLHEYKQFQTRTRSEAAVSGSRNPLQNSNLTNQMSHREPVTQNKVPLDSQSTCGPANKVVITVSRSETSGAIPSSQSSSVQTVAEYTKEDLICEGSELCFEEVRAQNYFHKLREQKENELREQKENELREQEENELREQEENELREQEENELREQEENELREQEENELREQEENELREQEEENEEKDLMTITLSKGEAISKWLMEKVHHVLENQGGLTSQTSSQRPPVSETANSLSLCQPSFERPPPSNRLSSRRSLGLRLHSDPTFIREAAALHVPPHQQRIDGTANIPCSAVSHHPSVLADRSVGLQRSAASSVPTGEESVLRVSVVQPPSVQQPVSFETADLQLHRAACSSAVNADVLSSSDSSPPPELNASHQHAGQPAEPQEKLDVSQGATANLSHITPNNSLGFVQATPSRVLPSPTVNTREALGVIMDMFQAPTFLEEPFSSTSVLHAAEKEPDAGFWTDGGASSFPKPPATAAFTIFQDDDNKENSSAAAPAAAERSKAVRALAEISLSKADKPNETPPDLIPDESTMWGARYNSLNSLAACPNSTSDFAMLAQVVSTPFACKKNFSGDFFEDQENKRDDCEADDDAYMRRQTKKLSPILEQSPSDEKLSETAVSQLVPSSARQGTIVGEGLTMAQHCLTTSSITMVQPPPPTVLSFRDQTIYPIDSSRTAGPGWEVYTSPEQPPKQASFISVRPKSKPFKIMEDVEKPASPQQVQNQVCDVPMSPECALRPDWLAVRSPEATVEPDLDAFLSPRQSKNSDVPMSPEQPQLCADVPMSPTPISSVDEPMMSPDRGLRPSADVSMNADTEQTGAVQLVSDPWDTELISSLLSGLSPPLTAHPRCTTWQCNIPNITPKMTISMGKQSLRVDCILGEGAFATVYQATKPVTLEKMVLKVQKPANPWEFYINTQLDARLQPDTRRLLSSMHSAHLFHNGSVLLGELHSYGTLLNAVNMYKTLSDKVMPQPLVMYFTICILHTVEQLHSVHIVHADIKPDNFLLGERFLENKCFDSESADHGLVLVDFGQSIDMELFPEGTAFTAKCLTSGFQCTEMLSGKPWNYQTDYFGIAGTVYCMLFGTYMQVTNEGGVWKTNAVFRRNPHSDLWLELFHTLLNTPDCGSPPSLRSLRCRLTAVLQENYSSKLASLKSRLVVLLLENRKAARR